MKRVKEFGGGENRTCMKALHNHNFYWSR